MKKFLKKAEGFTLVELIVVIAILGILTAVAVPAYTGYIDKANETADVQTVGAVLSAAQGAMAAEGGIDEVRVELKASGDADISAVVYDEDNGDKVYALQGEAITVGTTEKTVVATEPASEDNTKFVDADLTKIQADFELYFAGNKLEKEFKHKVPESDADNAKKVAATSATWRAVVGDDAEKEPAGWTFGYEAPSGT